MKRILPGIALGLLALWGCGKNDAEYVGVEIRVNNNDSAVGALPSGPRMMVNSLCTVTRLALSVAGQDYMEPMAFVIPAQIDSGFASINIGEQVTMAATPIVARVKAGANRLFTLIGAVRSAPDCTGSDYYPILGRAFLPKLGGEARVGIQANVAASAFSLSNSSPGSANLPGTSLFVAAQLNRASTLGCTLDPGVVTLKVQDTHTGVQWTTVTSATTADNVAGQWLWPLPPNRAYRIQYIDDQNVSCCLRMILGDGGLTAASRDVTPQAVAGPSSEFCVQ